MGMRMGDKRWVRVSSIWIEEGKGRREYVKEERRRETTELGDVAVGMRVS